MFLCQYTCYICEKLTTSLHDLKVPRRQLLLWLVPHLYIFSAFGWIADRRDRDKPPEEQQQLTTLIR